MALTPSFPAPTGKDISSVESARALAGLVARDQAGVARAGLFLRTAAAVVTARANMAVNVAAFEGIVVRNGIPSHIPNDGAAQVAVGAAPGSNRRIDVVYVKQNQSASPFTDGNNDQVFGYVSSDVLATPLLSQALSRLPAGALPLAAVTIPSGATSTQSTSPAVTIEQIFPYTATSGGMVPVRNQTELNAWTPADGNYAHRLDIDALYNRDAGQWVELVRSTAWETYTPNWTASAGAPAIGNGTLTGRFRRTGKTVEFRINLVWGTNTSGGVGDFAFSLPLPASGVGEQVCLSKLYTAGNFDWIGGASIDPNSPSLIRPKVPSGGGGDPYYNARNANPAGDVGTGRPQIGGSYTFTSAGHNIVIQGIYEIA